MKLKLLPQILGVSLAFGLIATGISLILPNRYTAKGLLIVTRKSDEPSKQFFTYEGYYGQQNAQNYLSTFLAILQSPNNLRSADKNADIERLMRLIKAKKDGQQIISLSTKGGTAQDAAVLWNKIADSAIETHRGLKPNADALLDIVKTPNSPIVLDTYPDWQKVLAAGFATTGVLVSSAVVINKYLKEGYDS